MNKDTALQNLMHARNTLLNERDAAYRDRDSLRADNARLARQCQDNAIDAQILLDQKVEIARLREALEEAKVQMAVLEGHEAATIMVTNLVAGRVSTQLIRLRDCRDHGEKNLDSAILQVEIANDLVQDILSIVKA